MFDKISLKIDCLCPACKSKFLLSTIADSDSLVDISCPLCGGNVITKIVDRTEQPTEFPLLEEDQLGLTQIKERYIKLRDQYKAFIEEYIEVEKKFIYEWDRKFKEALSDIAQFSVDVQKFILMIIEKYPELETPYLLIDFYKPALMYSSVLISSDTKDWLLGQMFDGAFMDGAFREFRPEVEILKRLRKNFPFQSFDE